MFFNDLFHQVVFSDEKVFQSFSNGHVLVKRKRGEANNLKYINFAIQQEKFSVNVWCCISYNKKVIVKLAGSNFNSVNYINLIDECFKNDFEDFQNNYCFQQDNASIHKSSEVLDYFKREKLMVLRWPPCSPDLNIAENIWSEIQKKLTKYLFKNKVRNENDLFIVIKRIAESIEIQFINKLYDTIKNRLEEVIKNKGGFTSY